MYRNYFKIAIRNFLRNKTFTLVNLSGLAIGLASVIMILSYVLYELSYDRHYSNSERIYRLVQERNKGNITEKSVLLPEGLATTLEQEFPEVEAITYVYKTRFNFILNEENISFDALSADPGFFRVFNLSFIYGNPLTALKENLNIVITEKIAKNYFPGKNPVGEKINSRMYDGSVVVFTISGVIKDIPPSTHFKTDVIIGSNKIENLNWQAYSSVPQYVLLRNRSVVSSLNSKLTAVYNKYNFPKEIKIQFQPVTSIHLHSNIADEPFANSDIRYIYIFSSSALLILLIACINYVNLTTARSLQRVREVGVRKVLGAGRKQLTIQFICESFLFFFTALPFALLIANLFWPFFTEILNIEVGKNYLVSSQNILIILVISIISGILSGLYPSLFLSNLQPATILKDWQKTFKVNLGLRKTLIVLQFVISLTLIISTIVIYRQINFYQ